MNQQEWVYLAQLTVALQQEGVEGSRAGEFVAEIDTHLMESEVDPVAEFGTPFELAEELASRPGSRRPGWLPPMGAIWLLGLVAAVLGAAAVDAVMLGWGDRGIPLRAFGVVSVGSFYAGVVGLKYASTRRLDGRTWSAVAGPRALLIIVAIAAAVTTLSSLAGERVIAYVPTAQFWSAGGAIFFLILAAIARRNNPVRFPPHAQHLNRLKRGWLAGRPPSDASLSR